MTSATRTRALEIVRDVLHDEMCPTPSAVDADRCAGECGRVTRDVVMKLANAKLLLISQEVPEVDAPPKLTTQDDVNGMRQIARALGLPADAATERVVQGAVAAVEMVEWVNRAESTRDAWALVDAAARDAGLVVPTVDTTPEHVARIAVRALTERAAVELLGDPVMAGKELAAWRTTAEAAWQYMSDPTPKDSSPGDLAARLVAALATAADQTRWLDAARTALGDIYVESVPPSARTDDDARRGALMQPGAVVSRVHDVIGDLRAECTRLTESYAGLGDILGVADGPTRTGAVALRVADLVQARAALTTIAQAAGMSDVPATGDGRYATDVVTALWEHAPAHSSRILLEVATLLHVPQGADAGDVAPRVRELIAEVGTLRAANDALGDIAELAGCERNAPPAQVLLAVQVAGQGMATPREVEVLHEVARSVGLGDHPVLGEIAERVRNLRGEAHRNALCAGALDEIGRALGLPGDAPLDDLVGRTRKVVESLPGPGVVAELEKLRDVVLVVQGHQREVVGLLAGALRMDSSDAVELARAAARELHGGPSRRVVDPAAEMVSARVGALTALVMAAHDLDPTGGGLPDQRPDLYTDGGKQLRLFDEQVRSAMWLLARAYAVIEEGVAGV